MPKLSICIPTYNRAGQIRVAIISVLSQVDSYNKKNIELCISDNNSDDDTKEVVVELSKDAPINIIYSCNSQNIGPDRNFLRAVEMANGEYCWILGSDDAIAIGGINKILGELDTKADIYLFNRFDCDVDLKNPTNKSWFNHKFKPGCYDLSNYNEMREYCRNAVSIGATFSYLSSNVFLRERWLEVKGVTRFLGTGYPHVYKLLGFAKSKCIVKYIDERLVYSRGSNDSFLDAGKSGLLRRVMLDIRGYQKIAFGLFHDRPEYYRLIIQVLKAERPPFKTLSALRYWSSDIEWLEVKKSCEEAGYPVSQLIIISKLKFLICFLRNCYKSAFRKTNEPL